MRSLQRGLALTLALSLLCAPLAAQPPAPASAPVTGEVVVNMRGVELRDVAAQVSRVTGRTIVLDPSVQGQVNVVSAEPLSSAGVWDLFQSVLRVHGFVAIRSGAVWRVVPQAAAAQSGAVAGRAARPQDVVTRLIRLRNIPSEQAQRVLRPLVAQFGSLEAVTDPNAIIVTDYADNVRRIEVLAQQLDGGGGTTFDSIALRYADARDVGQALARILGDGTAAGGGPRVAVDERANLVIVRGDATDLAEARRVALLMDVPGGAAPVTRVFRLNHADAESLIVVLQGIMGVAGGATNPAARSLQRGDSGAGSLNRFDRQRPNSLAEALGGAAAAPLLGGAAANLSGLTAPAEAGGIVQDLTAAGQAGASAGSGFTVDDMTLQAAPELNAIVARGTAAQLTSVEALIRELDVRRPQVQIEAAIVEITGQRGEQLGVQLGAGQASPLDGGAAGTSFSNAGISLQQILGIIGVPGAAATINEGGNIAIGSRDDFSILIQALATSSNANLLSTPSVTVLDNAPAEIVVAQNVPFRTGSFTTEGNSLNPFTTIEREDVGITLRIIPRVNDGDVVRLQVSQEVSSLAPTPLAGAADLITNRRSIQTTILADDGQTIVLGGLITDDRVTTEGRVPVLGDVPVLGALFRSRTENQTRRTLFIFLRSRILRDGAAVSAAARQRYDRLRVQDAEPERRRSLLLEPTAPRLTPEIEGIY